MTITNNSCNYDTGAVGTVLAGNGAAVTPTFQPASTFSTTLTSVDTSVHLNHVGLNYDLSSIGPTPYIVGAVLGQECNYTSIQTAMNDAFAAGGGVVLIRQKTTPYVENLTFRPGVDIIGWSPLGQIPSTVSPVVVQGNHTFTSISNASSCVIQGVTFTLSGSNTLITVTVPDTFFGLFVLKECGLDAPIAGQAGLIVNATNTGTCVIAFALSSITSDQACISVQGTGGHLVICDANSSLISGTSNAIESIDGTIIVQLNPSIEINGGTNCISLGGTTAQILMDGIRATSTNETINFVAGISTASVVHSTIDCSAGSGFWVAGTGSLQWADVAFVNTATALDPSVSQTKLNWQPYAEAGTVGTTPAGTASFDSSEFTVTDGFVSLFGSPGLQWLDIVVIVPGAVHMAPNTGYLADHPGSLTFLLPAICPQFATVAVVGGNSTDWHIDQNAGQNIQFGNQSTTIGAGGSLSSTNQFDVVYLLCTVADTTFTVTQAIGNLTVV